MTPVPFGGPGDRGGRSKDPPFLRGFSRGTGFAPRLRMLSTRFRTRTFSALSSLALTVPLLLGAGIALGGCNLFKVCGFSDETLATPTGSRGSSSGGAEAPSVNGGTAPAAVDATRAVAEADIVQLDGDRNWLYAVSRSGWLSVVDASQPRRLDLLGQAGVRGVPFEMYRRPGALLVMSNQAVRGDGSIQAPLPQDASPPAPQATGGALLTAIDLSDPANPKELGTFPLPGEIADSRIVGDVLYVATYENASCWSCAASPRTVITSFDVSQPASPRRIDQIGYDGAASYPTVTTTTTPWKRSLLATDQRLYVGGISETSSADGGVVEVLDISDPTGKLVRGARIALPGPVLSRWQMDEYQGHLRVVSQRGSGYTANGTAFPEVDVFRVDGAAALTPVGHTTLTLPRQEGLKAVRFDGTRAYAITFETVTNKDPLFTIDLSDPKAPVQRGALDMPGWVFHIVPKGDRLLGLGLDRTSSSGQLNVSLFDVADLRTPKLVQRVDFGPRSLWDDATITNTAIAEDQDRIQKSFRVFDDGLVTIPYSDPGYRGGDACTSGQSGVQLIDWNASTLTKRALLRVPGNPRRALRRDAQTTKEVLAISDAQVVAFDIAQRDAPIKSAEVTIGQCVVRTNTVPSGGGGGMPVEGDGRWGGGEGYDTYYSGDACE